MDMEEGKGFPIPRDEAFTFSLACAFSQQTKRGDKYCVMLGKPDRHTEISALLMVVFLCVHVCAYAC